MANWNALFPRLHRRHVLALMDRIEAEKRQALAAFEDRHASRMADGRSPMLRRVASVVALGSDQSFGGCANGLPFMDIEWLDAQRKARKTLFHDGVETVVDNRHNFDKGWLWFLRGDIAVGDVMACYGAYARVRASLEKFDSPYGEIAVRQALLDEFPHMLQVIPILACEDKTAVSLSSSGTAKLAVFGDQVEPHETCTDALRRVVGDITWRARSAAALRFERDTPAVTLVHHVTLDRAHRFPHGFPPVAWAPTEAVFKARKGDCADLIAALRAEGRRAPDDLQLDPDDAEAFILTV